VDTTGVSVGTVLSGTFIAVGYPLAIGMNIEASAASTPAALAAQRSPL
jgi:hypothetical protein